MKISIVSSLSVHFCKLTDARGMDAQAEKQTRTKRFLFSAIVLRKAEDLYCGGISIWSSRSSLEVGLLKLLKSLKTRR